MGCQHIDVAGLLIYTTCHFVPVQVAVEDVAHAEIDVVLYLVDGNTQAGIGFLITEITFDMGAGLFVQFLVPPEVLRVVVL